MGFAQKRLEYHPKCESKASIRHVYEKIDIGRLIWNCYKKTFSGSIELFYPYIDLLFELFSLPRALIRFGFMFSVEFLFCFERSRI